MVASTGNLAIDEQIEALQKRVFELYAWWSMWKQLFAGSKYRRKVLGDVAPDFFYFVGLSLRDSVLLGLCRLTDPPGAGDRENLCLKRVIDAVGRVRDPARRRRLTSDLRWVEQRIGLMRNIRHKRLAHNDLSMALERVTHFGEGKPMKRGWQGSRTPRMSRTRNGRLS